MQDQIVIEHKCEMKRWDAQKQQKGPFGEAIKSGSEVSAQAVPENARVVGIVVSVTFSPQAQRS